MGLFKKLQSGSQPSFKFQTKRFSFGTILWTYRLCFLYSCRILSSPFVNVLSAVFYDFQNYLSNRFWNEVVSDYRKPVPSKKSMSGRAQVSLTSYYLFDSLNKYWISAERWYGSYSIRIVYDQTHRFELCNSLLCQNIPWWLKYFQMGLENLSQIICEQHVKCTSSDAVSRMLQNLPKTLRTMLVMQMPPNELRVYSCLEWHYQHVPVLQWTKTRIESLD